MKTKTFSLGLSVVLALTASPSVAAPLGTAVSYQGRLADNQVLPSASVDRSVSSIKVNRTAPRVEAPRTALEFSTSPTPEDLFRARLFEEPLVQVGAEAAPAENAALAAALVDYSKRASPDDFSSLTGFLENHPQSPWRVALLTDLGLEYYNTAHYSLALEAWKTAWPLAKDVTEAKGKVIADRAVGELAYMYARLGRMTELDALLKSVQDRVFCGPATERISGAREGLATMKENPGIAFRCGPLALHRIKLSIDPKNAGTEIIYSSASTQRGFSLLQVAELSQKLDLNYQMACREKGSPFVFPSVVHWKVGHYAAMIRQEGGRYLVQDPTFQNDAWVTKEALEAETSGYFLIPPGALANGWRTVEAKEGKSIWGKGIVGGPDPGGGGGPPGPPPPCKGMAVASSDLLFVSLSLSDEPVGYSPPVGPAVRLMVRYNQRDASQPANFTYSNFGAKWTLDWLSYITDNPSSPNADVQYYRMGGFIRLFTAFDSGTQSYATQQLDLTKLTRTSPTSYEMLSADGSKLIFSQSDGSAGTTRKIFLTQIIDPFGNALSLTYDASLRIAAITDAIGQVTTLTYGNASDIYKITKVTDPFGRAATFDYDASQRLIKITDVIGLTSQFTYDSTGDVINSLITPYGTNSFTQGESGTTRWLETLYPDGGKDRLEFNQSATLGIPYADPSSSVPTGMATGNRYLYGRNTFYWSKIAYTAGYGDYTKAKIYHWLHTRDGTSAARILESEKEPLEGRVWYEYAGQSEAIFAGDNNKPTHIGRVLDDGTTQLYTYQYNGFGKVTQMIDPVGRTFSYIYATNGIDLLETRMTRLGANELLSQTTYNAQHLPLAVKDASGQTTTYTYNARGQVLTEANPRGATTACTYDSNGYRISIDGPLPGTGDTTTWTYDSFGRVRTKIDVDGYTLAFDYDALDRLTKITFPDSTFDQYTYSRLDHTLSQDRAGRQTSFEYNNVGQMTKHTDPLNRVSLFQWCKCGDSKSLTDPMGRTTIWLHDIQGRVTEKQFADGSKVSFLYENTTSRLRQRIDEKLQVTQYTYNRDDTVSGRSYANAAVATPPVAFAYDANYNRVTSMTDGIGTTRYRYIPISPTLTAGAGQLASVDGPLPNDTITFNYNESGRRVATAINGIASTLILDISGRIIGATNALGVVSYSYDGNSLRRTSEVYPNAQTVERIYGNALQDHLLQRITYKSGNTPISEFIYNRDVRVGQISSWSQQTGAQTPFVSSFVYDDGNQLTGASISQGANVVSNFSYSYDPAGNRLTKLAGATTNQFSYNSLNELTTQAGDSTMAATNTWDAEHRLVSVTSTNGNTQFTYDGLGRRVGIRLLVNGAEVSNRRFVWCDSEIWEERDTNGVVSKRFFDQGVRVENGRAIGNFYYTRDHLGSIRELSDSAGNMRASYSYDSFGHRTRLAGDLAADFGFAGMFWADEAALNLTRFRAYDPNLGRWLSRDPLENAEIREGYNLFSYVHNDPVSGRDPLGLCCDGIYKSMMEAIDTSDKQCKRANEIADNCYEDVAKELKAGGLGVLSAAAAATVCVPLRADAVIVCQGYATFAASKVTEYHTCMILGCAKCKK